MFGMVMSHRESCPRVKVCHTGNPARVLMFVTQGILPVCWCLVWSRHTVNPAHARDYNGCVLTMTVLMSVIVTSHRESCSCVDVCHTGNPAHVLMFVTQGILLMC